ncbi:hypothetical protein ABZ815_29465 [Nonomuraea sp. NPDC047529]|uniref:hypothetical protein n=1 Tax=Nonomuraea sp. NPDC047529 TaxID=3155623 RepID=UPI003402A486
MFWKRSTVLLALLPLATALAGQSAADAAVVTGVVRAVPDVGLRSEPRVDSKVPARIPTGHRGTVSCYVRGSQSISGWGGTNPYWNYTEIDGRTGYIPDVWLDTGGDITTQVPECGSRRTREPDDTREGRKGTPDAEEPLKTGQACVFLAPKRPAVGPVTLGHVGWGFQVGRDEYVYGATENPTAQWKIDPGKDNGAWRGSGNLTTMREAFRKAEGYSQYKCAEVSAWKESAARAAVSAAENGGYLILANNCMDHTYKILTAYGAALPNPGPREKRTYTNLVHDANVPSWIPRLWFASIPWVQKSL